MPGHWSFALSTGKISIAMTLVRFPASQGSSFTPPSMVQTNNQKARNALNQQPSSCKQLHCEAAVFQIWMLTPSTWFWLHLIDSRWLHLITLDSTGSHFSNVADLILLYYSWHWMAKGFLTCFSPFLIVFSLFLTFSQCFSLFIMFYNFGIYHLCIQNPVKTNPSKSAYQDRFLDLSSALSMSIPHEKLRAKSTPD